MVLIINYINSINFFTIMEKRTGHRIADLDEIAANLKLPVRK